MNLSEAKDLRPGMMLRHQNGIIYKVVYWTKHVDDGHFYARLVKSNTSFSNLDIKNGAYDAVVDDLSYEKFSIID